MNPASFQIRGWHVLAAMLAFFGVVIAVNVIFAIYAVRSFPGEDVPRSYVQGLRYNETLAERRAQAALGWQASASLARGGEGAVLEVLLRTREGSPLDGAQITGELEWPTTSQFEMLGLMAAVGLSRLLDKLLFGVTPLDPVACLIAPGLLLLPAGAACLVPAWRGAAVPPTEALRCE